MTSPDELLPFVQAAPTPLAWDALVRHLSQWQDGEAFEREAAPLLRAHLRGGWDDLQRVPPLVWWSGADPATRHPALEFINALWISTWDASSGEALLKVLAQDAPLRARVRRLRVETPAISGAGLGLLAELDLPALEELALAPRTNQGPNLGALQRASWLGQLRTLDVSGNLLGNHGALGLLGLLRGGQLDGLQTLSVGSNSIDKRGAALVEALGRLSALTSLDLKGCKLDADGLRALVELPCCARLQTLDLSSAGLKGADLGALLDAAAQLRRLAIGGNRLNDEDAARLAEGAGEPRLEVLHLEGNALKAAGVEALVRAPRLAHLRDLNLSNNAIGGAGLVAALTAPGLPKLLRLDLSACQLEDKAIKRMAKQSAPPRLQLLKLDSNRLTGQALLALLAMGTLRRLEILSFASNAGISEDDLATLTTRPLHPTLQILNLRDNGLEAEDERLLQASRWGQQLRVLVHDYAHLPDGTMI